MNDIAALLPIILLVAIFYLFIIRPQGKRRREFVDMQQKVTVGSRVMITSGVFGTVKALGDETMTLEIAPGVDIEVHRNVVAKILDGAADTTTPDVVEQRPAEDEDGKA
ncbi:preprotein translocase subunit YajC [Mumia sp. DW29H23]|uniref:preprotein translocase subunit YajC n=1 Tax=Mumia sp. DW29H23 TaxID=3421241 RepID=UPI003D68AF32